MSINRQNQWFKMIWFRPILSKGAFTYDVRCFLGIFDLPTYHNQMVYYISLFSKIRCSLTYLPTQKSDVICECSLKGCVIFKRYNCVLNCLEYQQKYTNYTVVSWLELRITSWMWFFLKKSRWFGAKTWKIVSFLIGKSIRMKKTIHIVISERFLVSPWGPLKNGS